jgi:hypothetical protein
LRNSSNLQKNPVKIALPISFIHENFEIGTNLENISSFLTGLGTGNIQTDDYFHEYCHPVFLTLFSDPETGLTMTMTFKVKVMKNHSSFGFNLSRHTVFLNKVPSLESPFFNGDLVTPFSEEADPYSAFFLLGFVVDFQVITPASFPFSFRFDLDETFCFFLTPQLKKILKLQERIEKGNPLHEIENNPLWESYITQYTERLLENTKIDYVNLIQFLGDKINYMVSILDYPTKSKLVNKKLHPQFKYQYNFIEAITFLKSLELFFFEVFTNTTDFNFYKYPGAWFYKCHYYIEDPVLNIPLRKDLLRNFVFETSEVASFIFSHNAHSLNWGSVFLSFPVQKVYSYSTEYNKSFLHFPFNNIYKT